MEERVACLPVLCNDAVAQGIENSLLPGLYLDGLLPRAVLLLL